MAQLATERVLTSSTVKTVEDLTVPAKATHALLQADTQDVRYTMDGITNPTQVSGMVFGTSQEPKQFLITDVKNIRFVRGSGSDGYLNVHYYAGRDV